MTDPPPAQCKQFAKHENSYSSESKKSCDFRDIRDIVTVVMVVTVVIVVTEVMIKLKVNTVVIFIKLCTVV